MINIIDYMVNELSLVLTHFLTQ